MANKDNIGPNRLVVGAHYGLRDWLAQRATGVVMAVYTILLLVMFLGAGEFSYQSWAGLFAWQWFKLLTLVTFAGLFYHTWVGVRNIFMDYIKPVSIRLVLQVAAILWLIGCAAYLVQILWRV